MKKIVFRADANTEIGWGHFFRSFSVAQMLRASFEVMFLMYSPPTLVRKTLAEAEIPLVHLPHPLHLESRSVDQSGHQKTDLTSIEAEIIVLDGYHFNPDYLKRIRRLFPLIVEIIDDTGGYFHSDGIINQAPCLDKTNFKGIGRNLHLALGPDFAMLRPDFLSIAKKEIIPKNSNMNVFVSFGGADFQNLTEKFSHFLLNKTNCAVHTVGGSQSPSTAMQSLIDQFSTRLSYHQNLSAKELLSVMLESDWGIVPSSGMLVESIAARLPVYSGYYVDNQRRFYQGYLEMNAIFPVDNISEWTPPGSLPTISQLNKIRTRQAEVIDGKSNDRILAYFEELG